MTRARIVGAVLVLTSLAGCSSSSPASDDPARENAELAREDAERNALLEATKSRFEDAARNRSNLGKLPPLPGVDYPAPKSPDEDKAESHHDHSANSHDGHSEPPQP